MLANGRKAATLAVRTEETTGAMDRIESCISFQIGKAAQQIGRRGKALLSPYGVTPLQYAVLKCLSDDEGLSGAELGARLVLDSASITGVVDRLVALGLAERRPDKTDRRVLRLHLSAKSKARQGALDQAMDRLNAEAAALLGPARKAFAAQLTQLSDREKWKSDV